MLRRFCGIAGILSLAAAFLYGGTGVQGEAGLFLPSEPSDDFIAGECGSNVSISKALELGTRMESQWKKIGMLGISYGSEIGFWRVKAEGNINKVTYTAIPIGVYGKTEIAPPLFPLSLWLRVGIRLPYIMTNWDKELGSKEVKKLNGWGLGYDSGLGLSYHILPCIDANLVFGFEGTSLPVKEEVTGVLHYTTITSIDVAGMKVGAGISFLLP
jgi:hypothetical protein